MSESSAPYLISGCTIPASFNLKTPPVRMDVCDLREKEPRQFSLFVQSWERIMQPDFRPKAASFQEIAGIHGMPYSPWFGEPDEVRQSVRGPWLGYCNHGSILFPTWHRPYLMLLEQIISDVAHGIVGEILSKQGVTKDEAAAWLEAAENLRLPFWDWANPRTGEYGIPEFLITPEIDLLKEDGKYHSHNNVLSHYRLNYPVDGFDNRYRTNRVYKESCRAYYKEWTRTYRHPNSQAANVTENYTAINARLTDKKTDGGKPKPGSWVNLTNDVARMFAFPVDIPSKLYANAWDEFSNTTFQSGHRNPDDPKDINSPYYWNATSLEQPHNTVHLLVGGIGHMSDNDTASFDPIFYLHHCNVDRLLAFWESIYPDYVAGEAGFLDIDGETRVPFTQGGGTWIQTDKLEVTDKSPLLPFRNPNYEHWNSEDAHSLLYHTQAPIPASNKYYTYPPIVHKGVKVVINTDPTRKVSSSLRNMQRAILQRHFKYDPRRDLKLYGPLITFSQPDSSSTENTLDSSIDSISNFRQFFILVSLDPQLINGSYELQVFATIENERYEVGSVAVLSRGTSEACGNCRARKGKGVRVRGVVVVPHEIVYKILAISNSNTTETSDDEAVEAIQIGLKQELVLPDGTIHSKLRPSNPDEGVLSGSALPSLRLVSCAVYQRRDFDVGLSQEDMELFNLAKEIGAPYDFHDWKDHTALSVLHGQQLRWVLE